MASRSHFMTFLIPAALLCLGLSFRSHVARAAPEQCGVCGTWIIVDRVDRTIGGDVVPEPTLGRNPAGILVYDRAGNVSVQLMKQNRKANIRSAHSETSATSNNTGAGNGYDAYFGKYKIDYGKHTVTHLLEGSILPDDVGKSVTRTFALDKSDLILSFDTENGGVPVRRFLHWRRISQYQ